MRVVVVRVGRVRVVVVVVVVIAEAGGRVLGAAVVTLVGVVVVARLAVVHRHVLWRLGGRHGLHEPGARPRDLLGRDREPGREQETGDEHDPTHPDHDGKDSTRPPIGPARDAMVCP